jgi:cytochrome c oxidase subunit 5b
MRGVDNQIPSDHDGRQAGRRADEMDAATKGITLFNRDPITPPKGQGTYSNPITVPCGEPERAIGFVDPATHSVMWFNLQRGEVHYIDELNMFFKMDFIGEDHH